MRVVGIITEYNPFHNGHKYHIEKAKELTHADYVVVVMSGNFVQRGTPAVTDKYTRTHMVLSQGADLVIELPVIYATASAEYFSMGAVSILDSLGFIDCICFGSECGDIEVLSDIAKVLAEEPDSLKETILSFIKKGISYPSARMQALLHYFQKDEQSDFAQILSHPNNILGIEYLKALHLLASSIQPYTLLRSQSAYHDKELHSSSINSATAIRNTYHKTNDLSMLRLQMPTEVYSILSSMENKTFPVWENDYSNLLYYKLLSEDTKDLERYMDVSKDLALRIKNNIGQFESYNSFIHLLKSKQITFSRLSRALLHILLNIKTEDFKRQAPYIRVLGLKQSSSFLLKQASITPKVPIITKVANAKKYLSDLDYKIFEKDIFASNLYNYIIESKFQTKIKNEFQHGIIIFSEK